MTIRGRLVTLLEILETSAEAWWRLASLTGQMLAKLECDELPPIDTVIETLAELRHECIKLKLTLAQATLDRFGESIGALAGKTVREIGTTLKPVISDLNLRIWDQLKTTLFLVVSTDHADFYKQTTPLFGADIESKFPNISEDISEAGKCLALSRYTATVFHLSRAMEIAVIKLGETMGVTVVDKDNSGLEWGKILSNLSIPIERMQRGEKKERWSSTFTLLTHTKIAWRNPTMHPKQTYTEEQALEIFSAARSFIRSLAELV